MPQVHGLPDEVAEEVALIVESSGSTGTPKRIELSANSLLASANASADYLGGHGQWLLALPINYIAGINVLVRSVVADTQPVMMNTQLPFTAEGFSRAALLMTAERRYTSLVPLQLSKLAAAAQVDPILYSQLKRFDAILVGGQLPDMDLVNRLRSEGIKIVVSYGMAETAGGCVYDGYPLQGVDVKIESGLIAIAGPTLANGLGDWFVTQDLGDVISGRLEVLGRADRVIISGGVKVSLESVEQFAAALPGVMEVAAISIKSSFGESVAIVYTGSPEVSFAALADLSIAAKPAKVIRVEKLPRLVSGKPDLMALQAIANQ
jgi:O-succinylbenzoic acid--CoA ligase